MKNSLRVAALSLLIVVTMAGCFKAKVDVSLNSDNTIDGTMVIAVQAGVGESLGMSDDDLLGELTTDVPGDLEGATSEDYNEDGYVGKIFAFKGQPLDAFASGGDGGDIAITREGDTFVVDGSWDTQGTDTEGMDPAAMGAEFTFAVTFPGKVSDHNGELSDDGHTVTWNLLDPPATLHAEGGATEGSSLWGWLVIALGLLIITAVIVVVVVKSRRKKASAAAPPVVAPAESPAVELPAVELPAGDAPAVDAPAVDAPAVDAPAAEEPKAPDAP